MNSQIVLDAFEYSARQHKNQKYGDIPYSEHLTAVFRLVADFVPYDYELHAAALLHDVLEDTPSNYSNLKSIFGERVAEIVYAVTDELGKTRKERKQKTFPKIKNNYDATVIKVADRICNIQYGLETESYEMLRMHKKEHEEFKRELYKEEYDETMQDLWSLLSASVKLIAGYDHARSIVKKLRGEE